MIAQTPTLERLQKRLAESQTGVLVVGHGTRKPAGQQEFLRLVEHMRVLVPCLKVFPAFLELAEPSIEQGVQSLAEQGCTRLVVLPVLLFYAGHARSDIPSAVQEAASAHGIEFAGMSAPLDTHPGAIHLSARRFQETLSRCLHESESTTRIAQLSATAQPTATSVQIANRIGVESSDDTIEKSVALAMVGRGTSDEAALDRMREFTRIRCSGKPFRWSGTGFFAGGEPRLDELFGQAAKSCAPIVIVQPHLLFEGELMDQLRALVTQWQERCPGQRWCLAGTLGAERALAEVFLTILEENASSVKNDPKS